VSVSGSGGIRDAAGNLTTRPDWLLPPFFFASAVGNNSATFMAKKRRHVFNFFFLRVSTLPWALEMFKNFHCMYFYHHHIRGLAGKRKKGGLFELELCTCTWI
jgi:hypothetical protein